MRGRRVPAVKLALMGARRHCTNRAVRRQAIAGLGRTRALAQYVGAKTAEPAMTLADTMRRSWVLRRRPSGEPSPDDFELREEAISQPAAGEVLTRTLLLSIDPYMRGRLREQQTYATAVQIGEMMTGETVGTVVA